MKHTILTKNNPTKVYFFEAVYSLAVNKFMIKHGRLFDELSKDEPDEEKLIKLMEYYKASYKGYFESFNYLTEEKLLANLFPMYMTDVPKSQHSEQLKLVWQKNKTNLDYFVNHQIFDRLSWDRFFHNNIYYNIEII